MFRKQVMGSGRRQKDRITWRNHEVTRIEAFSDAVLAFAITLLIFSLEVPETFAELYDGMRSFIPFAICFTLIFQIWTTQNTFFRRYGLHDTTTLALNGALLFMVLFFAYPLKFLFNAWLLGKSHFNNATEVSKLFTIYGGAYTSIYLLFTLMYWNALNHRHELTLTPSEIFETKTNIYRNLAMASIGVLSIIIALTGGPVVGFSGMIYILIGPVISILHTKRGKLHRKYFETPDAADISPADTKH